jgi:hypothetical protein
MTDTPQTGSILVRRGPTTDRAGFTPQPWLYTSYINGVQDESTMPRVP